MTAAVLDTREFDELRAIILDVAGIRLSENKRTLLEGRLARRLRERSVPGYRDYLKLVRESDDELREMVNAVTTNKTSFFREPHHFATLGDLLRRRGYAAPPARIWSAGCSTGEEPYTIAMTARDASASVRIVASDIDTNVLERARRGVYPADQQDEIPADVLRRHFLRGRGENEGRLSVRPELKRDVDFRQINLIHPTWPISEPFDVIFCRNVIIYFERQTQDRLFHRFASLLRPGGLLILGHSESVSWLPELFELVGQTTYRLRDGSHQAASRPAAWRPVPVTPPDPIPVVQRLPMVRIDAGDVRASRTPFEVRTVLGSCVAACLYDPVAAVGGMNHFMLPDGSQGDQPARYGVHAMELLINEIMKLGGERSRLRAKVFGAANVIRMERSTVDVGRDNAEFVRRFLATERIPIDAEKLGGTRPLEVRMETTTGRVRVRELGADTLGDLIDAERERQATRWWRTTPAIDDITDVLF